VSQRVGNLPYSEFFKRPVKHRVATAEDLAPEPERPTAAARCIEHTHGGPCHQQPDFFRTDGRCVFHGKRADGLLQGGEPPLGQGMAGRPSRSVGRADG